LRAVVVRTCLGEGLCAAPAPILPRGRTGCRASSGWMALTRQTESRKCSSAARDHPPPPPPPDGRPRSGGRPSSLPGPCPFIPPRGCQGERGEGGWRCRQPTVPSQALSPIPGYLVLFGFCWSQWSPPAHQPEGGNGQWAMGQGRACRCAGTPTHPGRGGQ